MLYSHCAMCDYALISPAVLLIKFDKVFQNEPLYARFSEMRPPFDDSFIFSVYCTDDKVDLEKYVPAIDAFLDPYLFSDVE